MTIQEAINSLTSRPASRSQDAIEARRMAVEALRGWEAVQYLTSARSVTFQYDNFGKMCQCWVKFKDRAFMTQSTAPAIAAIAAAEKVGGE